MPVHPYKSSDPPEILLRYAADSEQRIYQAIHARDSAFLRAWRAGWSSRQIANAAHMSYATVIRIVRRAERAAA